MLEYLYKVGQIEFLHLHLTNNTIFYHQLLNEPIYQ
nr:MAG TPA: hypothetical protein [Bacteriophage sp.]